MGGGKQPSTTVVQSGSSTSSREPTAEETELNRLQLEREKYLDPYLRDVQGKALSLSGQLLSGDQNLPGWMGGLAGGISPDVTSSIVQESLSDIQPQFQRSGLLDSGVNAAISARVAGDIRRASEEFNIGNRLNLLNMALGGQYQAQQPTLGYTSILSQRLAGLGQTTTSNYGSQTTTYPRQKLFGIF